MAKEKKAVEAKLPEKFIIFAKKLRKLTDTRDELDESLKAIKAEMEAFNEEFVELMRDSEMQKYTVAGAGTCFIQTDIYPDVKDEAALFADLRANDAGSLIKETVNFNTLKAYCKEQLDSKNKLPAGVEVFPKPKVRIRRSK